ncbi:MAG TPA: hypothetical protein VND23_01710 [Acidimicrobiales bacterium]|nr:hypothetical protein [Acidimicrobiales bacterium]
MLPGTHAGAGTVERYLSLGLAMGRHVDGFVDAYYGPGPLARRIAELPALAPPALVDEARSLLAAIDAGEPLGDPTTRPADAEADRGVSTADGSSRRRWLRAQVLGVLTSARILAGERVQYADEVEACYGVRPRRPVEDEIVAAHRALDGVVPGSGSLSERYVAWREAQAVPPDRLLRAIESLAEDLRERTDRLFGLPEGERVEWVIERDKPWSGFNYYLGRLVSRVAINVDLPVLSTALAHLVAHEAYPGHHTEHSRKEVGLVQSRHWWEESIFLVGTPQCLVAEGLADLGLEVVMGEHPERAVAAHFSPLGIPYDADTVAVVSVAAEALSSVRALAAFRLHEDGADPDTVVDEVARLALLPRARARKAVDFLLDPTWRSYISCYVEGLPLCRAYVAGMPDRFARLVSEQCLPEDLAAG